MFLRSASNRTASDEALVLLVKSGDRASLGYLWDRYAHLLFGVCMKYLKDTERSKDCVAELFADLPEILRKHQVERFRPWLHTVMRNRCLHLLRGDGKNGRMPEGSATAAEPEEHESAVLREAELQRLEEAIGTLNEGQRVCVTLFHLERRSYDEVTTATGYSLDQVRSHLQNGRRNLRLILERHVQQNAH